MLLFQKLKKGLKSSKNDQILNAHFSCVICLMILFVYGCANIKQPMGGPKDVAAPKILKVEPLNLSLNFSSKKITILFDEFFKLQNESKEFSISPEQEIPPILTINKKKLEIKFEETLKPNTTYTLNFGKSIVDINEGNVLKNVTYVFSTGQKIDSLSIEGNVKNALTGLSELDVLVFVYPAEVDSLFGKKKPAVYTRTDSSGHYSLKNLREGKYKIYALKDKNGDKIYQAGSEEIGFLKDTIFLRENTKEVNFRIFNENPENFRVLDRKLNADGSLLFIFNKKLKKPEIEVLTPKELNQGKQYLFNKEKDSVRIWLNKLDFDSVKVAFFEDKEMLQEVSVNRGKKDVYNRNLIPKDNFINGQYLSPFSTLKLVFSSPITNIQYDKIKLLEDSVAKTNFKLIKDSIDFLTYTVVYPWVEGKQYNFKFEQGAFVDAFSTKSKPFDKKFLLAKKDDYGSLEAKITAPKMRDNYIFELLNDKKRVLKSFSFARDTTITISNFEEGRYFIRVIYDKNKNGVWDAGNFQLGIQPERIWYNPKESSIRGNWDRKEVFLIPEEPND